MVGLHRDDLKKLSYTFVYIGHCQNSNFENYENFSRQDWLSPFKSISIILRGASISCLWFSVIIPNVIVELTARTGSHSADIISQFTETKFDLNVAAQKACPSVLFDRY